VSDRTLTADDYRALAEFRYQIRQFLHFSEKAARSAGLNPQHHQLLLALKGIPKGLLPSINEIARRLHLRHHSVVELTNRLTAENASCGYGFRSQLIDPTGTWQGNATFEPFPQ